jgi:peptidyl-prolyl cis-trans isomerase B (cyclophilin B)
LRALAPELRNCAHLSGYAVFLWLKSPYHCPAFTNTCRDTNMVIIRTTFGAITLELDAEKAPKTVANFLQYAQDGFYDGTIFHRVIDNFMIQGGGFDTDFQQKETGESVENEADNGLKNDFGTIAMARTMEPHSATAQFFINVKDNDFLNHSGKNMQGWGYTVFGKITDGAEVLDKIRAVPTTSRGGHQDVPTDPVIIESVEVVVD